MKAVHSYVRSPPPGYALLLSGDWGVGKTYAWVGMSQSLREDGYSVLTLSAAGLSTLEDLERALLDVSIQSVGPAALGEAGAIVGRALLRLARIDPEDVQLKADFQSGRTVVCIDDVERFSGEFATLFGFVVRLLDAARLHCVLIADERRVADRFAQFGEDKARIIGKTVPVRPDRDALCDTVIAGFGRTRSQAILMANREIIGSVVHRLGISNLRTVKFFLSELESIFRCMPEHIDASADVAALIEAVGFWVAASARDARSVELLRRAFASSDLGIVLATAEIRKRRGAVDDSLDDDDLVKMLQDHGMYDAAMEWPRSEQFLHLTLGEDVDYAELAREFRIVGGDSNLDPLSELQCFRTLSDERIQQLIPQVKAELLGFSEGSLQRWFDIYKTVHFLCACGLARHTPEEWTESAMDNLSRLDPSREFGPVEFFFPASDEVESWVRKALQGFADLAAAQRAARERASIRARLLAGKVVDDGSTADFFDADVGAFHAALASGPMKGLQAVTGHFRSRLRSSTGPQLYAEDRRFAFELAERIRGQVRTQRPMTVRDASLLELESVLRLFVQQVDGFVQTA